MKVCLFLWIMMLTVITAFGQKSVEKPIPSSTYSMSRGYPMQPPVPPPNLFLKTNLFSLVEPDMAVTLSAEYRQNIKKAYQLELGYIFLDGFQNQKHLTNSGGFRIKPEWRFYTRGRPFRRYHFANYFAVEAIIKAVYNDFYHFVGQACGPNGCAYQQQMHYRTARNILGIGGKVGREIYLDPQSKRIILDFYFGAGVRYRWKTNSLPPDASPPESHGIFSIGQTTGTFPYISAGIKIGTRIF